MENQKNITHVVELLDNAKDQLLSISMLLDMLSKEDGKVYYAEIIEVDNAWRALYNAAISLKIKEVWI